MFIGWRWSYQRHDDQRRATGLRHRGLVCSRSPPPDHQCRGAVKTCRRTLLVPWNKVMLEVMDFANTRATLRVHNSMCKLRCCPQPQDWCGGCHWTWGVGSLGRQVLACEREGKVHSTVPALHQSPFSGHLCSWVWLNFPSNRNQLRPKHSNRKSSTAGVALLPQWRRTAEKQCGEAQYLFKRLHRTTRYRPDCRACKTGEREGAETKYNSTLFTARCFAHSREKLRTDLLSGWRVG